MKAPTLLMAAAFLAVSVPAALTLQALDLGGDYRLLIAMALGAVASGVARTLAERGKENA